MNTMQALQRQFDEEAATIAAGSRSFHQPMSAAEHWAWRALYVAIAAAGILASAFPEWIVA